MFAYARMQKPRAQGPNGQPITGSVNTLCQCGCHQPAKPPPAVEHSMCQECSDARFQSWHALMDVLLHED